MAEKIKGIRLEGELLKWWENNKNAPDEIRGFIKRRIKKEKSIKEFKQLDKKSLDKLLQIVKTLEDNNTEKNRTKNNKDKELNNKLDNLINKV